MDVIGLRDIRDVRMLAGVPEDPDLRTVGGRIKYWREKRGLTQQQLADRLGTTQGRISDWQGGKQPGLHYAALLSEALDRPLEEFTPSGRDLSGHAAAEASPAKGGADEKQAETRVLQQWARNRERVIRELLRASQRLAELAERYQTPREQAARTRPIKTARSQGR